MIEYLYSPVVNITHHLFIVESSSSFESECWRPSSYRTVWSWPKSHLSLFVAAEKCIPTGSVWHCHCTRLVKIHFGYSCCIYRYCKLSYVIVFKPTVIVVSCMLENLATFGCVSWYIVMVGYQYTGCEKIYWDRQATTLTGYLGGDLSLSSRSVAIGWSVDIQHFYHHQEGRLWPYQYCSRIFGLDIQCI